MPTDIESIAASLKVEFSDYVNTAYQKAFRLTPFFDESQEVDKKIFFGKTQRNDNTWYFLIYCARAFLLKLLEAKTPETDQRHFVFIQLIFAYIERHKIPENFFSLLKASFENDKKEGLTADLLIIFALNHINVFYQDLILRNDTNDEKILKEATYFEERMTTKNTSSQQKLLAEIKRNCIQFVNQQYRYAVFTNDIFKPRKKVNFFKVASKKDPANWEFLLGCFKALLNRYYQEYRDDEFACFRQMLTSYFERQKVPVDMKNEFDAFISSETCLLADIESTRIQAIARLSFL